MPTIDGLISGIDSAKIIEGLLAIHQRQIDQFNSKRETVLSKKAAVQGIEARMLSLRSMAAKLGRTQNSALDARTVSLSREGVIAATATNKAAVGVYQLRVNSLAAAHQVAAQGYADLDSQVTQGTLQLQVGSGAVTTITVDGTNNTLQGVADAINNADGDVAATIIQDASGGAAPYRLLLTSKKTGASNAINITNNLAASSGGAARIDFNVASPVQAAANASVTLGSGAGAITVTSDSNRIDNLIGGVTLDLLKADPAESLYLTIAQNPQPAADAVAEFVDGFNDLMEFIDEQVRYESETGNAGILIGNRAVIQLQDDIRSAVLNVVPGVGSFNRLSAMGISVTDRGRLQLNSARLDDVLNGRVPGVSSKDVLKLFSLSADSTHQQVQFVLGSSRTKASTTPYGVDITQAAEQASLTGTSALADSIVIDGTNNTLSLTVDGAELENLRLTAGTYTRATLAEHLQAVIDASTALQGRSLTVGLDGNSLKLTSATYGAASEVVVAGGTALATLGLTSGQSDVGVDVAGSFVVNGQTEAAIGRGRVLTGDLNNENTADLQVRVTLTPGQVVAGPEASLTVTRGVASRLDQILGKLLDSTTGRVKQVTDQFDDEAADIQKVIDRQKSRFDAAQESLLKQFTALESAISELQNTSNFLTAQLSNLGSLRARN